MTRAEYEAKYGVAPGVSSAPVQTAPAPSPVTPAPTVPSASPSPITPIKMTRAEYQAKFGTPPPSTPKPEQKGNFAVDLLKSVVSAPATMVARPFQAVAQLAGASPEAVDEFSNKISGGLIAPVPQNFSDVKKDVGRGIQTVALGTGAPIAAGAAFGVGGSLEQGNDLFSTQTVLEGLLGAGAGKVLGLVGKPLLDVTGKVVGTITPKILKDVASKGAGAVEKFMAQHEIVPAVVKPAIAKIPKAAEAVDESVNKIFKGAGSKVKETIQNQYPKATGDNIAKHYEKMEIDGLMEPSKVAGKTFNKSADVVKDAKRRGIDIEKVAAENKIYKSEHVKDGKFDTAGTADALSNETMSGGPEILRPALSAASPGVKRVPISEIRNEILTRISKAPDAKISPEQKLTFAKKVAKEYGDDSVTAKLYKDGYDLTNLYDSKLQTSSKLYKSPKGGGVQSISDNLMSQQKQIESQVFDSFLRKNAPKELGLDDYFKAQEAKFALANYLRTLDGNTAPQSLFQRAVKKTSQLAGATSGATVAGPFGMFSGYQFGGLVADTFAKSSNPVKVAFLKSIGKTEPEIYSIMKEFTSKADVDKILRKALPGPSSINIPPTQDGKPFTPNQVFGNSTFKADSKPKGRLFKGDSVVQ